MSLDLTSRAADAHSRRRGRYLATVIANVPLCREHNRLSFRIAGFPPSEPGQFVQVKCRDVDDAPLGDFPEREVSWNAGSPPLPPGEVPSPRGGEGSRAAPLATSIPARIERPPSPPRSPTRSAPLPGGEAWRSPQPDLLRPTPILRRPFSIAGRRSTAQGEEIDLINRDIGPGTHWLFDLEVGQVVDLIGPLGNTFQLPEPGGTALLVGGGVGIPPMIYIAQALAALNATAAPAQRRQGVAFCGSLSIDLMPLAVTERSGGDAAEPGMNVREFAECGIPTVLSTDDGSYGYHGRVTGALVQFLDRHRDERTRPVLYTCGPEPMMKAVAAIARERGLPCQVAVERAMACGMGTCQSCVIRQVAENERGWRYRLACTDGPVFEASTLLW